MDGTEGAAPGAGGEGGGAGAAAIAAAGGEGGGAAASWRDTLPDDLKSDASLANFADVSALAKGYLDTKRTATARLDSYKTDDGLKQFAEIVRPADAAAYDIPVADEQGEAMADRFRAFAHSTGIPVQWAKAIAEWHNGEMAAAKTAEESASQADVDAFKGKIGQKAFDDTLESIRGLLDKMPTKISPEGLAKLDVTLGSAELIQFLGDIAARVGDPKVVEGAGGGERPAAMTPDQAKESWGAKIKDPSWRAQAKIEGTPEYKEAKRYESLLAQGKRAKST